ncbi:16008_t:CDS:1, partial [Dentiscutata erythropus]
LKSSTFVENELPKINSYMNNNTETTSVYNFSSEHTNEYIDYYGTNTNDQEYFNNESCQYNQESEQIQSNWEPDEEV